MRALDEGAGEWHHWALHTNSNQILIQPQARHVRLFTIGSTLFALGPALRVRLCPGTQTLGPAPVSVLGSAPALGLAPDPVQLCARLQPAFLGFYS